MKATTVKRKAAQPLTANSIYHKLSQLSFSPLSQMALNSVA